MKIHPRVAIMNKAEADIRLCVSKAITYRGITSVELIQILAAIIESESRLLIRDERHPGEPDKRGGEA